MDRISKRTGAPSTDLLTTLNEAKLYLDLRDGSLDSFLETAIARATRAIEQACNRRFALETVRDTFQPLLDGIPRLISPRDDALQLARFPVVSVETLVENGVTLTEDTDFEVDPDAGQIWRLNQTGARSRWLPTRIVVDYSAGYAQVPDDLKEAAHLLVQASMDRRGRDPWKKSERIHGVIDQEWWVPTGADAGNMPSAVVDLIDNYRVPVVA